MCLRLGKFTFWGVRTIKRISILDRGGGGVAERKREHSECVRIVVIMRQDKQVQEKEMVRLVEAREWKMEYEISN